MTSSVQSENTTPAGNVFSQPPTVSIHDQAYIQTRKYIYLQALSLTGPARGGQEKNMSISPEKEPYHTPPKGKWQEENPQAQAQAGESEMGAGMDDRGRDRDS